MTQTVPATAGSGEPAPLPPSVYGAPNYAYGIPVDGVTIDQQRTAKSVPSISELGPLPYSSPAAAPVVQGKPLEQGMSNGNVDQQLPAIVDGSGRNIYFTVHNTSSVAAPATGASPAANIINVNNSNNNNQAVVMDSYHGGCVCGVGWAL
ncbi:hypothetical protein GOP47_0009413 [Adiantum capillus-veneris]|uniref:Uncharacterized protein n=1 Tax=Adiantum capillus-veneris TaxID=13818 RepID=A0A9D4ZIP0_ADICA|nr:hypothetical protein GOP47_0009413 [Adiantum capillus-veneris]